LTIKTAITTTTEVALALGVGKIKTTCGFLETFPQQKVLNPTLHKIILVTPQ